MRLWRRKQPVLPPEQAQMMADVAATLRDSVQTHSALPVERDALLAQARQGALIGRGVLILGERLAEGVPEGLTPYPAIRALERVTCSLVAHAQSPPDPTGSLRPGELEALIDHDLREWIRLSQRSLADAEAE